MAVKIRLARRGRKRLAIYDIIVADARAPRDGRFIEKLGNYNPNTQPATILLKEEKALQWLLKGAQPTNTARNILSSQGVLFRKHLQVGVNKGALTQEAADKQFEAWQQAKVNKKGKATFQKSAVANKVTLPESSPATSTVAQEVKSGALPPASEEKKPKKVTAVTSKKEKEAPKKTVTTSKSSKATVAALGKADVTPSVEVTPAATKEEKKALKKVATTSKPSKTAVSATKKEAPKVQKVASKKASSPEKSNDAAS